MDIKYDEVIDFSPLKSLINERGVKVKWLAEKSGQLPNRVSQMMKNNVFPKTDVIAKFASVLKVPASQVVAFKGIEVVPQKKIWFDSHALPYQPEGDITGELTYEPLRLMMNMYLDYLYEQTGKEKTVNDLFDLIEPYRRRNGLVLMDDRKRQAAMMARGYGPDYKSARTDRKYHAKGLTPETRTKLKFDRPLNIRTIYDICNFFGCSIDWVMSYK